MYVLEFVVKYLSSVIFIANAQKFPHNKGGFLKSGRIFSKITEMHQYLVLEKSLKLTLHLVSNTHNTHTCPLGEPSNPVPYSLADVGMEGTTEPLVRSDGNNQVILGFLRVELNLIVQCW